MFKDKRSVIRFGQASKGIVLPKWWLDYNDEQITEVTLLGDAVLVIASNPAQEKKAKRILALLEVVDHKPKKSKSSRDVRGAAKTAKEAVAK